MTLDDPERVRPALGGEAIEWHAVTSSVALGRLDGTREGLSEDEADRRLAECGPNELERYTATPAVEILVAQFKSVVVALLAVAAVLAALLGDGLESLAIVVVLVINAMIGFVVELRARRAMDALLRYEAVSARVVRSGQVLEVPAERLVPGDLVRLEEGDAVPADLRLIEVMGLTIDEAPLTGESIPVSKAADPVAPEALLADRTSMAYSGTSVTSGRGTALVVQTGRETRLGRIGALIAGVDVGRSPLEVRLDALGHRLVILAVGVAGVVTLMGLLRGAPIGLMIETGVALAIAAVPEGLPAVATIALAVGLRRMAARHALVRRLVAVEALGATTVVCTDKTGTLTAGHMTVSDVANANACVTVEGIGYDPEGAFVEDGSPLLPLEVVWLRRLLTACALTSRATMGEGGTQPIGDPTDGALLVLALKGGIDVEGMRDDLPLLEDVPFTSHRRSSASVHHVDGGPVTFMKGAPAAIVGHCVHHVDTDVDRPLDDVARAAIAARNDELAARGLRVIALASGADPQRLTFLGMVGIVDPPAPAVPETIETLERAGVRTMMITGDQGATAGAIARAIGLGSAEPHVLAGQELHRLSPEELVGALVDVDVIARVSPEDKLRIVTALQARGDVVAMIGDGVNDAAALKKADVGVAMGARGTDVAKQAAAIVLTDDHFLTIGAAVEEGRVIFDNIRKFVFYLFSCNVAEVMVLLIAGTAGMPMPLTPLQILWLNIVTDTFPALALALEPGEPGIMTRPPRRPDEAIMSRRFVSSIGIFGGLITAATLGAYIWALNGGGDGRAGTIAFMTLALAQLFHLGNARSRGTVVAPRRVVANRWALIAVVLVIGLQLLAVYWTPVAEVLATTPLRLSDWIVVVGAATVPAIVGQVMGGLRERRRP